LRRKNLKRTRRRKRKKILTRRCCKELCCPFLRRVNSGKLGHFFAYNGMAKGVPICLNSPYYLWFVYLIPENLAFKKNWSGLEKD